MDAEHGRSASGVTSVTSARVGAPPRDHELTPTIRSVVQSIRSVRVRLAVPRVAVIAIDPSGTPRSTSHSHVTTPP
jgi:hypothetical protein